MSARIEPRDESTEWLIVRHERCGHETRYGFQIGFARAARKELDKPECGRCVSRRQAQQEEGKA